MRVVNNLTAFFEEVLIDLDCRSDTKSYLIHLYSDFRSTKHDLSQDNVSLLFCQARLNNDFYLYQQIADWIFWLKTMVPSHFQNTGDYYENIGRLSYYSCYRLINRQWVLFEELSDQFLLLERQARQCLTSINIQLHNI